MPLASTLSDYQTLASSLEADVDALALRLRSLAGHLHAVRAVGMLNAAARAIGTAAMHEQLRAVAAPSNDALLTIDVISPGADRADQLIRTLPVEVVALSERQVALRLGTTYDAEGARTAGEVMRRNGWGRAHDGMWHRPGYGAAAHLASERPR